MRFAATDEPIASAPPEPAAPLGDVRCMTRAQLRQLGTPSLVYLRTGMMDGTTAYAIYAADGTVMSVVDDIEVAVELVAEHGMTFVAVH